MRTTLLPVCLFIFALLATTANAQSVTILQPGPEDGKDALIKNCMPCGNWNFNNYGSVETLFASAWTHTGDLLFHRSLLAFDLSSIPEGAEILDARLSLYFDPTNNDGTHASLSGPNTALLMRIVEPWDAFTVTWDTQPDVTDQNQVVLPESITPEQDYTDIDVTVLINDMVSDPAQGHGFLLRIEDESYYRRVVFASSEHPDATLHPKLVITHQGGVGIEQREAALPAIHPNPTNGRFVVEGTSNGSQIEVFDALGQLVYASRSQGAGPLVVDLEGNHSGVYFAAIRDASHSSVQRIVLQ